MDSPPFHDPAFWSGDPYPAFAELRATDPLHRYDGEAGAFWAVTRHADVQTISKDPHTFCSGKGVLLSDLTKPVLSTDSIIYADPPEHAKKRKLVSPSLTVRRVGDLEPRVRQITTDLLDALDPTEVVDIVDAVSVVLPITVIAELVGVPEADRAEFRRWSDGAIAAATELNDENVAVTVELLRYVAELVGQRHDDPRDDLVSVLAHGTVDGHALSHDDINMFVLTLLVAGNETTRSLISNGLHALAANPDERQRLVDDPGLVPTAVEELLRWEAPIMSFCRTATVDTEVAGVPIAEGDHLLLCYQSANRDEAVYGATADRLDVGRDPNPHVSFGYAEHYCLGAGLARLEGRVLFEELLARWPRYEQAGPIDRLHSRLARGVEHLPVLLDPGVGNR